MIERDVFVWNTLIRGYTDQGPCREAIALYRTMHQTGVLPNNYTFPFVVRSCGVLLALIEGKEVHCNITKIGFVQHCESADLLRSLFDKMVVRNLVSWNAMIAAYEQNNACRNAVKVFRRMINKKVDYDYITMVSIITACASLGTLSTGIWLHELVRIKGFETNVYVTNAFIDMYAKCGNIDLAKDVFKRLPHAITVSWSSIVVACASHGHGDDALKLFSQMKERAFGSSRRRKHFESMTKEYSIVPGLEQSACLKEAYEFLERMPVEPNASVWGALLGACRKHSDVDLAELVTDKLFQLDPKLIWIRINTLTFYVFMSNIYAEAGRCEDVVRLKNLMPVKEMKKMPGHSQVEVNQRFYRLMSGSVSRPFWAAYKC
ncbi:hypothetical protein I3842_03G196500 [Carya illinoinensis]|uniref:Pentatricopeptide repeat-containing protein n=1 Tax=Carya illinoinensis TaxID=32201 RepID=A0A922FJA7_CARIL|nr:hypothetical protein I3842_03G196500 [Carya illinoinensis]